MEQEKFRMPATGEGWRHYKGRLYTIIGMAHHEETGEPLVVYTEFGWSLTQLPPIYVRPLAAFIGEVVTKQGNISVYDTRCTRFQFEREWGCDPKCPFISPLDKR